MSTEEERIRQWRAQLAEEADSDDDEGFGMAPPSLGMGIGSRPDSRPLSVRDDDMGLNMREPGISRLQKAAPAVRSPPKRTSKGPAGGAVRPGGALPGGPAERELILQHKLQVASLQAAAEAAAKAATPLWRAQGLACAGSFGRHARTHLRSLPGPSNEGLQPSNVVAVVWPLRPVNRGARDNALSLLGC